MRPSTPEESCIGDGEPSSLTLPAAMNFVPDLDAARPAVEMGTTRAHLLPVLRGLWSRSNRDNFAYIEQVMLEAFKHVFPIVASDKAGDVTVVAGTAFSIGDGRFMTAGHCVVTAFEKKWTAIGIPGEKAWEFFEFTAAEYDDDYDVGFFQAKLTKCETLKWTAGQVHMAEPVCSVGYPYAFDSESRTIGVRTFCGTVVATRKFHGLLAKPFTYELSFPCPRGLSGAPLFTPTATPLVAGVVIGNASMEMEVYSSKEVLEKDGKAEIYTRFEALQLGVAIRSTSILDVKGPKILGGTLGEHLTKHGLI